MTRLQLGFYISRNSSVKVILTIVDQLVLLLQTIARVDDEENVDYDSDHKNDQKDELKPSRNELWQFNQLEVRSKSNLLGKLW